MTLEVGKPRGHLLRGGTLEQAGRAAPGFADPRGQRVLGGIPEMRTAATALVVQRSQ